MDRVKEVAGDTKNFNMTQFVVITHILQVKVINRVNY